ncbi:hypothetical protein Tco_0337744, partial [Tanacetum coccineum]
GAVMVFGVLVADDKDYGQGDGNVVSSGPLLEFQRTLTMGIRICFRRLTSRSMILTGTSLGSRRETYYELCSIALEFKSRRQRAVPNLDMYLERCMYRGLAFTVLPNDYNPFTMVTLSIVVISYWKHKGFLLTSAVASFDDHRQLEYDS